MGVKFGMEEGTEAQLHANISPPSVQHVALAGRKSQNRPLSKLNTGAKPARCAARNAAGKDRNHVRAKI